MEPTHTTLSVLSSEDNNTLDPFVYRKAFSNFFESHLVLYGTKLFSCLLNVNRGHGYAPSYGLRIAEFPLPDETLPSANGV